MKSEPNAPTTDTTTEVSLLEQTLRDCKARVAAIIERFQNSDPFVRNTWLNVRGLRIHLAEQEQLFIRSASIRGDGDPTTIRPECRLHQAALLLQEEKVKGLAGGKVLLEVWEASPEFKEAAAIFDPMLAAYDAATEAVKQAEQAIHDKLSKDTVFIEETQKALASQREKAVAPHRERIAHLHRVLQGQ